jgi:hypothetical protein
LAKCRIDVPVEEVEGQGEMREIQSALALLAMGKVEEAYPILETEKVRRF